MAPSKSQPAVAESSAKKTKSAGGPKKKLTLFNKFMKQEMARLKEDEPDLTHRDRFKLATANWKKAKENPKAT